MPLYLRTTFVMIVCLVVVFGGLVVTTTDVVREDKAAYVFEFVSRNASSLATSLSLELARLGSQANCKGTGYSRNVDRSAETAAEAVSNAQQQVDLAVIKGLSRNPGPDETFFVRRGRNILRICNSDRSSLQKPEGSADDSKEALPIASLAAVSGLLSLQTFVANSSAAILADPPNYNQQVAELFKTIFRAYVASGKQQGTQVTSHDGKDYVVSFSEVSGTNIIVFSYQPLAIIENQVGLISKHLYKTGLVLAAVGLLLSLAFLYRLWRPLSQIRGFAIALRLGQVPPPISHKWRDEIRTIIDSLTDMFAAVRERERELQAFNVAQGHLVSYGRFMAQETSLDHIISSARKHAPAVLQLSESELNVSPNIEFPGLPLAHPQKPTVKIKGQSCIAEVIESDVSYGTVSFSFAQQQPNPLHRTLISGMANAIGTSLRALELNTKATQAAIVGREIEGCQMIQESILRLEGAGDRYALGYRYVPSAKIGGDWAGVYSDAKGNCAAYLIDVTGHGIQSAFASSVVAGVINTLHARAAEFPPLPEVIATLQQALARGIQSKLNLTLLALRFDVVSEKLSILNLCHPKPLVYSPTKGRVAIPTMINEMIGSVKLDQLEIQEIPFQAGDSIVLWTDGLVENAFKIGKKLTSRWLNTQFQTLCSEKHDAQEIASRLYDITQREIPEEEELDDVCVLVITSK